MGWKLIHKPRVGLTVARCSETESTEKLTVWKTKAAALVRGIVLCISWDLPEDAERLRRRFLKLTGMSVQTWLSSQHS